MPSSVFCSYRRAKIGRDDILFGYPLIEAYNVGMGAVEEYAQGVGYWYVNEARSSNGLRSLYQHNDIACNAGEHAGHIADVGLCHAELHRIPSQLENVGHAWDYEDLRLLVRDIIMGSWMRKEGHRQNMLSPYLSHMGIGVHIKQYEKHARQQFYLALVFRGLVS